ncbi:MAG: aminotransferase class V-fold PLP-dependent enzyme [Alphaproteobacteria bacterium]|nr:MAG: aminotransferase class V-fold PLP-dependent enzyme [Alphaproteobacteria bacterium]
MTARVYLDWNATAPLRPEARAAMLEAMDIVGNPSSVHAEGRAARAIVEKARRQVAALAGCAPEAVVFTSGATEAAALALAHEDNVQALAVEHDCVLAWAREALPVDAHGLGLPLPDDAPAGGVLCWQRANGETGVIQPQPPRAAGLRVLVDMVQSAGREIPRPFARDFGLISAHKLGGPKGVGALILGADSVPEPLLVGGGQERGRRAGTENVIGIAGFGAAAEAALRDLEAGVWTRVERLRDDLEDRLAAAAPELIVFGKAARRLPNTSLFAVPGWTGETQVMQMDLAGFAVSAGAACSAGKVEKASRLLQAMGFDETAASSAIRVSMGPATTEAEVMAFADCWIEHYRRRRGRAARAHDGQVAHAES